MAGGLNNLAQTLGKTDANGALIVTLAAGSAVVTSIAGTANQITASAATGAVVLSIPSAFIAPGSIAATTTVSGTTGTFTTSLISPLLVSASGNLEIQAGSAGQLFLGSAASRILTLDLNGHFRPNTSNNASDFGVSGNAWRTGYFGTSIVTPAWIPAGGTAAVTGTLTVSSTSTFTGGLTANGGIVTAGAQIGAGNDIEWNGRVRLNSTSNERLVLTNQLASKGFLFDTNVDGTAAFLSRAGADTAILKANKGVFTGLPAFVASDKYVVIDSSGNLHASALGPAS